MIINRRILRDFKKNLAQNIAYILLIVAAYGTIVSFNRSTDGYIDTVLKFQDDYNLEDGSFQVMGELTDKQQNDIEELGINLDEQPCYDYSISDDCILRIFGSKRDINQVYVKEGRAVESDDEIVLDCNYADEYSYQIGDKITIQEKDYKIVGLGISPDYCLCKKNPNDMNITPETFGVAYVESSFFDDMTMPVNEYTFTLNDTDIRDLKDYLNDNVDLVTWTPQEDNGRINGIIDDLSSPKLMATVEAFLGFLVVAFMISNMVSHTIRKDYQVIGVLYAQGVRRRVLYVHYLILPIILTVIGEIISYVLGCILSPLLIHMNDEYITPTVTYTDKFYLLFSCLVLPILIVAFFVIVTLHNTLKSTPLQLLRNEQKQARVGFLEKHLKLSNMKFERKFRIKNTLRNLKNNICLLIGVLLSCLILNSAFYMADSMSLFIDDAVDSVPFEYAYVLQSPQDYTPDESKTDYGCSKSIYLYDEDDTKISSTIYGLDFPSSYFKFDEKLFDGLKDDEIVISSCLQDKFNVKVNDTLTVTNPIDDETYEVTVKGIVDYISSQAVFTNRSNYNSIFDEDSDYYNTLFSNQKLDIDNSNIVSTTARDGIEPAFKPVLIMITILSSILLGIAIFILVTIIYLLLAIVIDKSSVNISMTKIFGYRQKEVNYIYINGKFIYIFIGNLLSLPFSYLIVKVLYQRIFANRDCTIVSQAVWWHLLIAFVVAMIGYLLSNQLLKRRTKKISYIEALKNRE